MKLSATSTPGKENHPGVEHGIRCGVLDPEQMDADEDAATQASFDYHGAYEEFINPTTGRKVRIPTAIIQHYNPEEHVGQSLVQPASQPPAPSLLQSVIRCIMPTSCRVGDTYNAADLPVHPSSVAQRLEEAAEREEHTPMGKAIFNTKSSDVKPIPSAIIDANKTDLQPGTVNKWKHFSLPILLANTPVFAESYQLSAEAFERACQGSAVLRAENKAIAGTLSAALDKDSTHVANFKESLLSIDEAASDSGYKLLHAMLTSEQCGLGVYRTA